MLSGHDDETSTELRLLFGKLCSCVEQQRYDAVAENLQRQKDILNLSNLNNDQKRDLWPTAQHALRFSLLLTRLQNAHTEKALNAVIQLKKLAETYGHSQAHNTIDIKA